jgi:tetratricopeptide (TPR) repeat protein
MKKSIPQTAILISLVLSVNDVGRARDLLEDAGNAFNRGDYKEAITLLERARSSSADCQIAYYLGLSRYRLHQLDKSIVDLASATTCNPQSVEFNTALAEAYSETGDDNRALEAFENVLKLDPQNIPALRAASALYLQHDMSDRALPVLRNLVALDPKDSRATADLAAAYAAQNQFAEAEQFYGRALTLDPRNVSALIGLGNLDFKTDRNERAIEVLSRAIRLSPQAYEPRVMRGRCYSRLKQYSHALADFQAAVQMGASDPEIYYHLSQVYRAMGQAENSQRALAEYKRLRDQSEQGAESQRDAERLTMEARRLTDAGDVPGALVPLERARALNPESAPVLFRLAGLYFDTGQYEKAQASIRHAIKIAPSRWDYHYIQGLIEMSLGQFDSAEESLETSVRLNPSAADAHDQLGEIAMRRNDFTSAIQQFSRAAELAPQESRYRMNLENANRLSHAESAQPVQGPKD